MKNNILMPEMFERLESKWARSRILLMSAHLQKHTAVYCRETLAHM